MSNDGGGGTSAISGGPWYASALTVAMIFVTPLVNFLQYHDYPLITPESLISLALMVMAGLAVGVSLLFTGPVICSLCFAFIITLFLDISFGFEAPAMQLLSLASLNISYASSVEALILAAIFSALFFGLLALGNNSFKILGVFFGVMLVSTLVLPAQTISQNSIKHGKDEATKADLPIILHLILDEHIGPEGIPTEITGARELRDYIKNFYRKHGFRLYGAAYSPYVLTTKSLSNFINFRVDSAFLQHYDSVGKRNRLKNVEFFSKMAEMGYKIIVYQSDFINFCVEKISSIKKCQTYPSNSIKAISTKNIGTTEKIEIFLSSYFYNSFIHRKMKKIYNQRVARVLSGNGLPLPQWGWGHNRVGPLAVHPIFDEISKDLDGEPKGILIFAHLLTPHFPYVYDRDCRVREVKNWLNRNALLTDALKENSEESRAKRYELYFGQVYCMYDKIGKLFEKMKGKGVFDTATILLHGDHGSRIAVNSATIRNEKHLSAADKKDWFSTLYAIKAPGIESGYDQEPRLIHELFARQWTKQSISDGGSYVFLPGSVPGQLERRSMKIFD